MRLFWFNVVGYLQLSSPLFLIAAIYGVLRFFGA